MEDDWDLQAVVRSCCGTASPTAPPSFSSYSSAETPLCAFIFSDVQQPVPDVFPESSHSGVELDDLWKPFCASRAHLQTSSLHHHHQHQRDNKHKSLSLSSNSSQHRSKRRKNQLKKVVCHVSAEDLCSDVWSWRKYGQKPIKGSPYPRGYYRCSSSKGCSARKQVERSKTDPTMFVLTYTSEHNHPASSHRNSLAGSTRLKCPENPPAAVTSNGGSSGGLSPATPLASPPEETSKTPTTADDEEENARGSMGNELEEDELFVDLEELRADVFASPEFFEECLSVEFPVLTDGYPQVAGDWVSL